MIATFTFAQLVRLLVICFGGMVVGAGLAILSERVRYYQRHALPCAVWAMRLLAVMNALVLAFVAIVLIDRWDQPLSWRWAFGAAIFLTKGTFFYLLRETGIEQERRALYGTMDFRPGDRPGRRSLGFERQHCQSGAPHPDTVNPGDPPPQPPYKKK